MRTLDTKKVGVRYPFINLAKALERAKQLFESARGNDLLVKDAFEQWKYSEKSSGGFQTVGALKMYGLLEDSGSKEQRRLSFTKECKTFFLEEREEKKAELIGYFALRPKIMKGLWDFWGDNLPADNIARSQLKIDLELNDQAARSILNIYKQNLEYADLKGSGKDRRSVPQKADRGSSHISDEITDEEEDHREREMSYAQAGEREVFREESIPNRQYIYLVAKGDVDTFLLEGLESFISRQRKRLQSAAKEKTKKGHQNGGKETEETAETEKD